MEAVFSVLITLGSHATAQWTVIAQLALLIATSPDFDF